MSISDRIIRIAVTRVDDDGCNPDYELTVSIADDDYGSLNIEAIGSKDSKFSMEEVNLDSFRMLRDFLNYALDE